MDREHPRAVTIFAGAQLRYLINSRHGILAAVALVLAVALLSLLWGPPSGSPLVPPALSRPWSGVGLVLISGLLAKHRYDRHICTVLSAEIANSE